MRKVFFLLIVSSLLLPACSKNVNNSNASVVKPTYHHRWYDRKKDKRTKRTKLVRMH